MLHANIIAYLTPQLPGISSDPPSWLNSVPPRAMRDTAPWVLAHDSPPLQHVHGPIALLVSGALGSNARPTDAPSLRRHVVEPLSRLSKVSVFVCVDRHNTSFASQALSWAETRAVHVDRHAPNQLERLRGCFERTVPENFALYVRTRPDAFWYGPLAVTTVDAISIRSRILFVPHGQHTVPEQALSWRCSVYRGPLRCSLLDDQFALVPARFREAFFLGKCANPLLSGECAACQRPFVMEVYQEYNVTARMAACELPVRIVASPVHLRSAPMPSVQQQQRYDLMYSVGPRWGSCATHERRTTTLRLVLGHRISSAHDVAARTRAPPQKSEQLLEVCSRA